MDRSFAASLTTLLCLCGILAACASHQRQVNQLADELKTGSPEMALTALRQMQVSARDRPHYLLDLGTLQLVTGDFSASIRSLQAAKALLEPLQAFSISESLAASTINETLRAYAATPGERVLLQQLLAINYLMQGNLDAARVEALQADVLMNRLARTGPLQGQLASARFVSGLVFELLGEWDNALISYRKAARIMQQRNQRLPAALRRSLLQISSRQGLEQEYQAYVAEFGSAARQSTGDEVELIVFYWDGVVSRLRQRLTTAYAPELQAHISLALPYYPPSLYRPQPLLVDAGGQRFNTDLLEDIDSLARRGLEARQGEIYAASLARVVSKHQAVKAAQRDSPAAGLLVNLATILSEVADTRSWNMLPATIQVARVSLSAGHYPIRLPPRDTGPDTTVWLDLSPGEIAVVLAPQVSQRVFSFSKQP
jgi:hypothetical protein